MSTKTYSDLIQRSTFQERYDYLRLGGVVADPTFAFERYLNQRFYRSREWRHTRDWVIARDHGCDLAMPDHEIRDRVLIHHMNPMTVEDITTGNAEILDPEFLISVSHLTHNAIHYGAAQQMGPQYTERRPGDTQLWTRSY